MRNSSICGSRFSQLIIQSMDLFIEGSIKCHKQCTSYVHKQHVHTYFDYHMDQVGLDPNSYLVASS